MISLKKMEKWIYLVTFLIPITNKNIKFSFWFGKGYFDDSRLLTRIGPNPPPALWKLIEGK